MIVVDGRTGEGGGQVLRSSLALSLVTGMPVRITHVRKKRDKPGLLRQHLTSLEAAVAISNASCEGAHLGSTEVTFRPGRLVPGAHRFAVGTAGSCMLVLATVLVPLALAEGSSELTLEGGTHNPAAPPYPFVEHTLLPVLRSIGLEASATLERAGFYPAGGGRVRVSLPGSSRLSRLSLLSRGKLVARRARALVANLPGIVATRELDTFVSHAGWSDRDEARPDVVRESLGPGNALVALLEHEHVTQVFTGFGEKGVPAERVGSKLAAEVTTFDALDVPVCEHLADQLLVPLAVGRGGEYRTGKPTPHFDAQCTLLRAFLDQEVRVTEEGAGVHRVEVPGRS